MCYFVKFYLASIEEKSIELSKYHCNKVCCYLSNVADVKQEWGSTLSLLCADYVTLVQLLSEIGSKSKKNFKNAFDSAAQCLSVFSKLSKSFIKGDTEIKMYQSLLELKLSHILLSKIIITAILLYIYSNYVYIISY